MQAVSGLGDIVPPTITGRFLVCVGAGGLLAFTDSGNGLDSVASVKEQIMLAGGVMTAVAMSLRTYAGFVQYTAADNVFSAAEGLVPGFDQVYQALFCYGWWDNPCNDIDGYWLCKNR